MNLLFRAESAEEADELQLAENVTFGESRPSAAAERGSDDADLARGLTRGFRTLLPQWFRKDFGENDAVANGISVVSFSRPKSTQ